MIDSKIINKSEYDKQFHKTIAIYHTRYNTNLFTSIVIIVALLVLTIQSITLQEYTYAIVMGIFAIVIFPILFFLVPYIINVTRYNTLLKRGNGKPFIMTIELTDKEIRFKSSLNEADVIKYEHIKQMMIYKDILIITTLNNRPLYLREDSYVRSDKESCHQLLENKTKLTIKEVK